MNARRNPTNVFWSSYLTGIQILLLLVLVFCVIAGVEVRLDQGKPVISFNTEMNPDLESKGPLKDQQWKTYALKLKEAGLIDEASRALQNYFSGHKEAWNTESSVITYNLALAWQDRKEYAKALPLLFQAEITAKDSELIKEIKKQQMICFEKMGQPLNASRILDQALSSLESSPPSEDVLATIGDSRITLIEYQEALKKLPTPLGEQVLQSTDQKKKFLETACFEQTVVSQGT